MPLNAATLAAEIESELDNRLPLPAERGADPDDREKLARAIAEAVVKRIKADATVTGVATGTCPPGTAGGQLVGGGITNGRVS